MALHCLVMNLTLRFNFCPDSPAVSLSVFVTLCCLKTLYSNQEPHLTLPTGSLQVPKSSF